MGSNEALFERSARLQEQAFKIIADTRIVQIWEDIGATINLVGSLKMGLAAANPDIDFHIYTDPFKLEDSFKAVSRLAQDKHIKAITYGNLLEEEDRCVEWHAAYRDDEGQDWQMDMIHILPDSAYAGFFERVAERINQVMTDELRAAILKIKLAIPADEKVMGIRIYRAVIEGGARDLAGFREWQKQYPLQGIEKWMPIEVNLENKIHIRPEKESDFDRIEEITVSAFRDHPFSENIEHLIIRELRKTGDLSLSLIAEVGGTVVGHIAISPVTVGGKDVGWYGVGPLSVQPEFQNPGRRFGVGQGRFKNP